MRPVYPQLLATGYWLVLLSRADCPMIDHMADKETLRRMCYTDTGAVKPKPECRAEMINFLILDETMDIDEAEDLIDKSLREFDLWGDPKLEDLLSPSSQEESDGVR